MSSRPSTVTGTQQALNKCLLKVEVLNARDGRGEGKRERRNRRVGKKSKKWKEKNEGGINTQINVF